MTELASNSTAPLHSDSPSESTTADNPQNPSQDISRDLSWKSTWTALLLLAAAGTGATILLHPDQSSGLFMPVLALLVCFLAAGFDAATSRIPNPITYTAILLGLAINSISSLIHAGLWLGTVGTQQAFAGFAMCAGIGILCLTLAGMGGGDLKLLVALGAILGFSQVSLLLLWTLMIAVPYSLINLIAAGRLNGVLRTAASQLLTIVYLRKFEPIAPPSRTSIPLAVPALIALFCTRMLPAGWVNFLH